MIMNEAFKSCDVDSRLGPHEYKILVEVTSSLQHFCHTDKDKRQSSQIQMRKNVPIPNWRIIG